VTERERGREREKKRKRWGHIKILNMYDTNINLVEIVGRYS
jgi:hypothetical protein